MVTETLCFLDAKIVVFVHGAKFECMHASLQTMGFRNFRIFRIFGIFEISELQCYQDKCSIMYQQTNWSSHPILFIHTHAHKCSYYLIMFGAEWRYVWVSFKACRPVQWTWDMRFASMEILNVIKNIQQDLEVCRRKSFTFMLFLPNRLHWKYTCAIIQFE